MRLVGLISGGKDSIFNLMQCVANGHEIVAVANLHPPQTVSDHHTSDEMDSYMYQTVGHNVIQYIADALRLPLFQESIRGRPPVTHSHNYEPSENDEVEDLYRLLKRVKEAMPEVDGVSSGAILSTYQRTRVEHVCSRLGLTSVAYLWQFPQIKLMHSMRDCEMDCIMIKTASMGLGKKDLGKRLFSAEMLAKLELLSEKFGVHPAGEGGEFESLTLDSPIFHSKVVVDDGKVIMHSDDGLNEVAFLHINSIRLEDKVDNCTTSTGSLAFTPKLKQQLIDAGNFETLEENDGVSNVVLTLKRLEPPLKSSLSDVYRARKDHIIRCGCFYFVPNLAFPSEKQLDIEDETRGLFTLLEDYLSANNLSFSNIIICNVYVRDMANFSRVNTVYKSFFPLQHPAARSCVAVSLPKGINIMVDVLASSHDAYPYYNALHVQSISYWAPANIGPYSQSIRIQVPIKDEDEDVIGHDETIFVSGQIGLIPESMVMSISCADQIRYIRRHVKRVLECSGGKSGMFKTCIWFTTQDEYVLDILRHAGRDFDDALLVGVDALPRDACVEAEVVSSSKKAIQVGAENIIGGKSNIISVKCFYDWSRVSYAELASKYQQLANLSFIPIEFLYDKSGNQLSHELVIFYNDE